VNDQIVTPFATLEPPTPPNLNPVHSLSFLFLVGDLCVADLVTITSPRNRKHQVTAFLFSFWVFCHGKKIPSKASSGFFPLASVSFKYLWGFTPTIRLCSLLIIFYVALTAVFWGLAKRFLDFSACPARTGVLPQKFLGGSASSQVQA